MLIRLITPAAVNSRSGNHTTAVRWKNILQSLGHRVAVSQNYDGQAADLMVALHAWRSADSIQLFTEKYPNNPLVVALTGTDIYRFLLSHPKPTLQSIASADKLVGLHARVALNIPQQYRSKVHIIYQSTESKPIRPTNKNDFQICVAGHLRDEKDSLRPAYAVRNLPSWSNIYVTHFGKAHTKEWAHDAKLETIKNSRYQWFGEIPQAQLRRKFNDSKLLALPSRMEGGANVISEAITAGLPVVASNIDGSIGLLGEEYPGYYPVENSDQLRELLLRCEKDNKFYSTLVHACQQQRSLFTPSREKTSWQKLLSELQ